MQRPDRGLLADSAFAFAFGGLVAETFDVGGLAILGDQAGWDPVVEFDTVLFGSAPEVALEWGGGLGALMAGAVLLVLVYAGRGPYRTARLTVLWTLLHLLSRGFIQVAVIPFTPESPAAKALEAIGWGEFGVTLAAITSVVALVGLGTLAGAEFAQFAREDFDHGKHVRSYVAWLAGTGVIVGFPLVVLLLWPLQDMSLIIGSLATSFAAVMGIAMAGWYVNVLTRGVQRKVVNFGLIVLTTAVAFGIRLYSYQG